MPYAEYRYDEATGVSHVSFRASAPTSVIYDSGADSWESPPRWANAILDPVLGWITAE